jgi:hypothetical protein
MYKGYCTRCEICYTVTYSRGRCEECGGNILPSPRKGKLGHEVRPTERVPQATYESRVQRASRRLSAGASQAHERFHTR